MDTATHTRTNPAATDRDVAAAVAHDDMANAIRALAMDAVEAAQSGHPGMPMGMADVATVLFRDFLNFDPQAPDWPDRDRFVLSAGHGSMLLYALLHLTGNPGMTLDQLRRFRQFGSLTPGHPEYRHTPGVETTTGPLGQGLANAVGMALAERLSNARHGDGIVDHYTYVIAGDGCLMEGISHEAIGLAGHLRLARLIVLFDDNRISIDGPLDLACSDDQLARFRASGWDVEAIDGHDPAQIAEAIAAARSSDRPSLIACRTTIGFGAPNKQGTAATHGAPLGAAEVAAAREFLGWPHAPFEIPDAILAAWRRTGDRGSARRNAWQKTLDRLDGEARSAWNRDRSDPPPDALRLRVRALIADLVEGRPAMATRKASEVALELLTEAVPQLVGGSADLTGSNNTRTAAMRPVTRDDFTGRYLHYGVREHAMAAAMNGMALHGGVIPYGGTFLVFADYCRPAIRLAAMMGLRVIHVLTHDSIGLGEDGPTHQPVEHLAALRAIPNLNVFRPADAVETVECWAAALASPATPSVIALSRQSLPAARLVPVEENLCARGAYVLAEAPGHRNVTLLATGSEISVALVARDLLIEEGIKAAVVSMPCWALFERQPKTYRDYVLGRAPRIAVEAGGRFGWTRYVDREDDVVGMDGFGASAPAGELFNHFGITAEAVADKARLALDRWRIG